MPGNRSTAERQRGVDSPVNGSLRARRAARPGPGYGSSRRCVDLAWFWLSSGSRAWPDKRRCGKDNGRSSSGYVQQPAWVNACSWFGCFDLLGSYFALLYCTNEFRRPGFRLSEKRCRIYKGRARIGHIELVPRLKEKRSGVCRPTSPSPAHRTAAVGPGTQG
jgi:hypothetical protein